MADHITQIRADYNAIEDVSDEAALRPLAILSITLARLLIGANVVEEDLEAANAAKEAATRALRDKSTDQVTELRINYAQLMGIAMGLPLQRNAPNAPVRPGGTDPTTLWRQQTRVDVARNQGLSKLGANSSDGLDTLVKLMEMWHVSTDPSLFEPKTIPDFPEPLNVMAMFKLKVASGANERARGLLEQLIACNPDWGWADFVAWAESTTTTPIQRTNRDIAASISEISFDWWAKHTAPDGRQSTPAIEFSRTMRNACTDALSSPHSELVASAILDKVDVSLRHLLGPNMARVTNVLDLCKMIESIPRDSYQSHLAQHERIAGLATRADIRKEMTSGAGRATAADRGHSGTQQQGRSPWAFDGFRSAPDPAPKSHASLPAGLQGSYFTSEDSRKPEHLLGISYSRFDDTSSGRRDFALACTAYMKQNPPTTTKPNSSAFPLTPGTQAPGAFRSCDKCGKEGHISRNCSGSPVNEVERRLRSLVRADSVLNRGPRNAQRTRMVALLAEDDQLDMIDLYETLAQLPSTDNLEDQDFVDA
ncbi:BZ3500_MvSof-1268-A1-R1_Chr3-1g05671 [Microbotryum saponariae]|uniref:BZ3500_MvSof-1268-A1-R1_Chr3-1g05671 protein n=1 Tax=Microbotryum saponariae TaxID=289078 RepID=A0A2X0LRI9_9BASI|nr:BZ3500_MvSof-1268-A1-R1_Chr3-1g05671 [Microbotryum saponariae]SDA04861.1 BZ3501_MvSof-1269-A2-R1_Chr3-1g05341 [Microbotryum saponariae]